MLEKRIDINYTVYRDIGELEEQDSQLLILARDFTNHAYAPYSNFKVGAVARLSNGSIVTGSNQENASFPAGLCAERVLLATASSTNPGIPIETIAISYQGSHTKNDHPVAPCGICRQSLQEFEIRSGHSIRLILSGMLGEVYIIPQAGMLLPLAFTSDELKIVSSK